MLSRRDSGKYKCKSCASPNDSTWESVELLVNERWREREGKQTKKPWGREYGCCVQRLTLCMCNPWGHLFWLTITFLYVCVPDPGSECHLNWSIWDPEPTQVPTSAQMFYELNQKQRSKWGGGREAYGKLKRMGEKRLNHCKSTISCNRTICVFWVYWIDWNKNWNNN